MELTPKVTEKTQNQNICTVIFDRETIMNAVIVCDSGWQYRLEIWKEMNRNNNTRSGLTTVNIKIIGSSVIGADVSDARINHLAFNISAIPKKDLSSNFQDATDHVRLYILK